MDKLRALARDCETIPRHPSNRVLVYTPASAQHSSYPFHEESLDISISGSIPYPWHQKVGPSPTTSFLFHLSPHGNPATRIPYPSPTPFYPLTTATHHHQCITYSYCCLILLKLLPTMVLQAPFNPQLSVAFTTSA